MFSYDIDHQENWDTSTAAEDGGAKYETQTGRNDCISSHLRVKQCQQFPSKGDVLNQLACRCS